MKSEKLYWRNFPGLKEWLLITFSLIGVACSTDPEIYPKQFIFELGQKSVEIDVKKLCYYEIGIMFQGKDHQAVKDFFGFFRQVGLPALIDVSLFDDSGKNLFSTVDDGGPIFGYTFGPNPLKLHVGGIKLAPGKYKAVIEIKDIEKDFSEFESSFFVSLNPKMRSCGGMFANWRYWI